MSIDNTALLAAIDAGKENAYGSDEQSDLGKKRARAIEYYLGLNTNPAPEGRSQVVDRSVYETISVMLPSLVRIFAGSSDQVCKCMPIGPEDEDAAEQQTAIMNHAVTQQNQWEQLCADWIHDAMLLANGYAMAYWDESENLVREVYEGQSEDQLAAIMQDKNVKVLEHSETVDEQATAEQQEQFKAAMQQYQQQMAQAAPQLMQMQAMGRPMPQVPPPPQAPPPVILHDITIERVENEGKVCIKVLPPEHCLVSADTPDWTLKDCPYFEFRQQKTIAELRSMGLEVAEDVSDNEDSDDTQEDWARDRFAEDRDDENGKGVMRRVWARMIWVRADAEGDDQSRMYYVIAVGRTILFAQPCTRIPVASITPQPLPHRHMGMAVGETVHDIQDIRTAVTRGGLDNLYLTNNGRHAISSRVNVEDFLESRPGGVIRMLDDSLPAEGHIMPLVHPFAFDQIINSLEYIDQIRQNRTGASRYFSGTDAGAINKTASGTMALQNMASSRMEHIARTMAPGVEHLFSVVQELLAKHSNKATTLKINGGKWVTVDPQAWRTKRDVRISVGVGAGNKDSMLIQLQTQLAMQMQLSAAGLAGPKEMYESVIEIAKLNGYANPEKFWVDVGKNPPQPQPNPEMVKIQMEAQAGQQKLQLEAQKAQADVQFKQQEAKIDLEKAQVELQIKLVELEIEKERLNMDRERAGLDMQLQQQKTQHEMQRSEAELGLKDREMGMSNMHKDREIGLKERESETKAKQSEDGTKKIAELIEGGRTVGIERLRDASGKLIGARRKLANGKTEEVPIA
jgi:hypothetical protein